MESAHLKELEGLFQNAMFGMRNDQIRDISASIAKLDRHLSYVYDRLDIQEASGGCRWSSVETDRQLDEQTEANRELRDTILGFQITVSDLHTQSSEFENTIDRIMEENEALKARVKELEVDIIGGQSW